MVGHESFALLPLWYAAFLLAITCHEAAHALAAYRGGDPTAYHGGQVTLNPLPHIQREPFGTVLVPLLSFVMMGWTMGWASAPYDPLWEDRHPRRAALMAAAGPLANLLLAVAAAVALKVGLVAGVWQPYLLEQHIQVDHLVTAAGEAGGLWEALGRFCSVVLSLNVLLFIFNLIPFPPLDGSAVLAGLFEPARRFRDQLRASGMGGMLGLLVAWVLIGRLFWPVLLRVLDWLYA